MKKYKKIFYEITFEDQKTVWQNNKPQSTRIKGRWSTHKRIRTIQKAWNIFIECPKETKPCLIKWLFKYTKFSNKPKKYIIYEWTTRNESLSVTSLSRVRNRNKYRKR